MDKNKLAALGGALVGIGAARMIDFALIGGSLATAAGAVGFASYMAMSGAHDPYVNGTKYLAIFGQPSNGGKAKYPPRTPANIDMTPVGAIAPDPKGYSLVGAKPTYAWLRSGDRIFAVMPGDEVAGLGRVETIERRDGRWALVDKYGAALIISTLADPAPADPNVKFSKPMIFGDR